MLPNGVRFDAVLSKCHTVLRYTRECNVIYVIKQYWCSAPSFIKHLLRNVLCRSLVPNFTQIGQ